MDNGSGRNILVIEDESDVADLLEMALRKAGFKTTGAADGASGLQKARDNRPDFIILDLMLPKMSGLELVALVRARYAQMPVVVASGYGRSSALDGEDVRYLKKPYQLTDLQQVIEQGLRQNAEV